MNIYEIGHVFFSVDEKNLKYSNRKFDNYFSNSYVGGIIVFFLKFFYSLFFLRKSFPPIPSDYNKILVYGPSLNNRRSLIPIVKKIQEGSSVLFLDPKSFPSWRLYWYSLPHFFDLLREIRMANEHQKRVIKYMFPKFWRMYGCEKVAYQLLEFYNPKVVIMSNDHLEFNRCLLMASREKRIETIYVQHAAVGTSFPPLQFSYSLLDGYDALNKYRTAGPIEGAVYLMGGVRFDDIKGDIKTMKDRLKIGVAINLVDTPNMVHKLCLFLKGLRVEDKNVDVVLRPHPQQNEEEWKKWCDENGILFSSPSKVNSFDFLLDLSVLIANQCSIHLDAAMCRIPSVVYYMAKDGPSDLYGFIENGLVTIANDEFEIEKFINCLQNYHLDKKSVRYYNCSYETPFEGDVASAIASFVTSILAKGIQGFNKKYNFVEIEKGCNYVIYSA